MPGLSFLKRKAGGTPQPDSPRLLGTFAGVFTPTLLTILGVIMFLRLGWVVGNAGLLGGFLVLALATGITATTGLSLASIATNTRLGAGGPYSIISRSLGFEVGGSVGLPLYLSQALAVAMYVFGFREGWSWIFPSHPAMLVDLGIFAVVLGIAYVSADFAFRTQYVIMAVIAVAIVAILANPAVWSQPQQVPMFGHYPGSPEDGLSGTHFWAVFAVFFPAATGIMAGANMSGELRNPRRSIPVGTLSAIAVSTVIYFALAVWVSRAGTAEELASNYTIMVDQSLWGPLVLAGLLGATFSSALTSLVGAPRILMALGRDRLVPQGNWVARTHGGEPRRALLITGVIVIAGLMVRDLNAIAPLITMFFLITYAVINVVMLAEASLGLMSFRPTLQVPRLVPLLGALGCVFAMFIVNPTFSLVAVAVVIGIYLWILWTGLTPRTGTIRSGIFVAFAEWAASKVIEHDISATRAWKPSLLVPVRDPARIRGEFRLLVDLCRPEGAIKLLGLATTETVAHLSPRVRDLSRAFQKHGIMTTTSTIDTTTYTTGIVVGLQALGSAFFRPNILFLGLPANPEQREELVAVMGEARRLQVGVMLTGMHPVAGLGRMKVLNLWLPPRAPGQTIDRYLQGSGINLALLTALRLQRSWEAELHIISVVEEDAEVIPTRHDMAELRDLCRINQAARDHVLVGTLDSMLQQVQQADIDIFGMTRTPDLNYLASIVERTRATCIFAGDSGQESALA